MVEFPERSASMGCFFREITDPAFIEEVVYPSVFGKPYDISVAPEYEVFLAQKDRRTGRVNVGYRFGADHAVFGKLYPEKSYPHGLKVMDALRATGFADGPYQAARPLQYFPEHGFLLTASATGIQLLDMIGTGGTRLTESVRRAAGWLVRLHGSPLRIGSRESLWSSLKLFPMLRRMGKVVSRWPGERPVLTAMIDRLHQSARENRSGSPLVQIHGRYHLEHIFISDETVTVIDFDNSVPSDPAKDIAEFLTVLRRRTFKRTGSTVAAHEPTLAFLEEYNARLPGNLLNLRLFWGAAILFDLSLYKKKPAEKGELITFLEDEFEAVISGKLIREAIG